MKHNIGYLKSVTFPVALTVLLGASRVPSVAQTQEPFYAQSELANAVAIQAKHEKALMAAAGVQGAGIGEANGRLAVLVLVDDASRKAQLPTALDNMAVSVRVVGQIRAHQCGSSDPKIYYSLPVPLGVSGGNALLFTCGGGTCCASGTIGFKVCDNTSGISGWISNNHVVGHGTDGCPSTAPVGTPQYQPGSVDNGCGAAQNIGTLNRVAPITFGGRNAVDAAFVQSSDTAVSANILNLGAQVNNVVAAYVGQVVRKNGRTSGCTQGTVTGINMTINVSYDTCGTATFTNQIWYSPTAPSTTMSQSGDSGAPVVDANNNAVALNFAGDGTTGFGNPMGTVLTALNVSLCSAGCTAPTAYSVTGGGTYCVGGAGMPVGLSSSQINVNYYLKWNGTIAVATLAGTGSALSFGNQTSGGTYTVVATNASGGCWTAMSGSAVVTIKARPTSLVSGSATICSGGSTAIKAVLTGTAPWNVSWSDGTNQSGVVSSPATRTVSPSATTTYLVTNLTDANCTAQAGDRTGSAVVTVNSRPTSVVSGSTAVCNGGSAAIAAALTGTGPWNVSWSDGINQSGVVSSPATRTVSPSATTTYTVTNLTDANCTAQAADRTGSAVVTVNARPTAVGSGSTNICNGGSAAIEVALTGTGPWNVSWSDGFNQGGVVSSPATRTVSPSATTTYTVTNLTDANCTAQAGDLTGSAAVTITPVALAAFSAWPTNGSVPLTVTFTNLSSGATSYLWDFGDGHTNTTVNPTNTYTSSGSNTVSLTAIGPCGTNTLTLTNYIVVTNSPALLVVSPTNWDVGTLIVGQSSTQAFEVVNAGGVPLSGNATTVPPFSVVSGSPFTVPAGQTGVVEVAFSPTQAGTFATSLIFTSNGGDVTNTVSGAALTPGAIVVSPASTNFGVVLVGTTASATFVVTNTSAAPVSNGVATVASGPFSILSGGSFSLAGFAWTNVVVLFTPPEDGTFSANVIFTSSGGSSTNTVSGVGQTPGQIAVTPTNWDFGWVAVGTNAACTFVVTNHGGAAVTGGVATISPPFSVVAGSNFTVAGFGTTNVVVLFTPAGEGTFSTNVLFSSANGGNATNPVTGSGAVAPAASFSADKTSGVAPLDVTFTDSSLGTITNRSWTFGDGGALSTNATTVLHRYSLAGTNTVSLTVSGPVGTSSVTMDNDIVVTNPPTLLVVNPTNWNFGTLIVGQSSTQAFEVVNVGGVPLSGNATTAPPFSVVSGSPFTVPAGQTGVVEVAFSPTQAGTFATNLLFASNGGNVTDPVSGIAINPAQIHVVPAHLDFGTVVLGSYAERTFLVTNEGGTMLSNGVATVGAPFTITSGGAFDLPGFGSTNVIIRFTPASAGNVSDNVVFTTSNAGASTNTASGTAVTPSQLAVSPASVDFGLIMTGATAQASFVVSNAGGATLQGEATVDAPFAILSGTPFTLDQSLATNLAISFAPTSPGVFSNAVVFTSNGGSFTNPVTGRAVGAVSLLSPGAVSGDFLFSFDTVAGLTYVVQYKDDLNYTNWQVLQTVSGDGTMKTITNSLSTPFQRFYRLSVE